MTSCVYFEVRNEFSFSDAYCLNYVDKMMLAATVGLLCRLWFTKLCTFVDIVGPYSALK